MDYKTKKAEKICVWSGCWEESAGGIHCKFHRAKARRQSRESYARWSGTVHRKEMDRNKKFKARYGLTLNDYNRMFKEQGGRCALCCQPDVSKKRMAVDHDHKSGKVRGLLCNGCNKGLGFFQDSLPRLRAAIDYLKENRRA